MRTGKFKLKDKEYLLCFSLRAVRACTERYGSVDKIFDALGAESEARQLDEALWLLALMMDCGSRYAKDEGIDNPEPLTVDELYDTADFSDFLGVRDAIVSSISGGNSRNVEVAPDKKKKEIKKPKN